MRKYLILLSLLIFTGILPAQETVKDTLSRKELRQKRKTEKNILRQKQYELMYQLLEERRYVLEAEFIQDHRLNWASVNPLINFVMVDSSGMIAQLGALGLAGVNGAGGSTGKGTIRTYKLSKHDKDKTFSLVMGVDMNFGHMDICIDVDAGGEAKADLSFGYSHLIYNGHILQIRDSKIVIGRYL
jgi:hypothetical protein